MRDISPELQARLELPVLTLAFCLAITDRLGGVRRYTSHDRPITVDAVTYYPYGSVSTSAVKQSVGSGVDNLDLETNASDDTYSLDELKQEILDSNSINYFIVDYEYPAYGVVTLMTGHISDLVLSSDAILKAVQRGLTDKLKANATQIYSPTCRCKRLGDNECNANLASVTFTKTVASVTSKYIFVLGSTAQASGYFDAGIITGATGNNATIEREVKQHVLSGGTAIITLREPFPYTVQAGDTFSIVKGCDRTPTKCKTFVEVGTGVNNIINFRGECFLPGNKTITKPAGS